MDVAGILAATAGVAALAKAAKNKGKGRRGGSPSRGGSILTRDLGSMSVSEALSGRLLVKSTRTPTRGRTGTVSGPRGVAAGSRGRAPDPRHRPPRPGHARRAVPPRLSRHPDRAQLERQGVPHPLIVKRRRDRRRELLREVANVGMGSAAIGVSTAGLLFGAGTTPDWCLAGGALAAVVFGSIFGRGVLADLVHLEI